MKTNDDLNLIRGFADWFKVAASVLLPFYTGPVVNEYEDFETFAVEVFFEEKLLKA